MSKTKVTVLLQGEELNPYFVDLKNRGSVSLGEFLEVMPHGNSMLIDAVGRNRVSLNGREIDASDWYSTYLGGEEIFIAILAGGVVAGWLVHVSS